MTITRRMMLRLTDEIRRIRHGLVILNGESLGQVASLCKVWWLSMK